MLPPSKRNGEEDEDLDDERHADIRLHVSRRSRPSRHELLVPAASILSSSAVQTAPASSSSTQIDTIATAPLATTSPLPHAPIMFPTTTTSPAAAPTPPSAMASVSDAKKPGACVNCRRSKHACRPSDLAGEPRCARCAKRDERCEYKKRFHEEEWQAWAAGRIRQLTEDVSSRRTRGLTSTTVLMLAPLLSLYVQGGAQQQQIHSLTERVEAMEAQIGSMAGLQSHNALAISAHNRLPTGSPAFDSPVAGPAANNGQSNRHSPDHALPTNAHFGSNCDAKRYPNGLSIHVSVSPSFPHPSPVPASQRWATPASMPQLPGPRLHAHHDISMRASHDRGLENGLHNKCNGDDLALSAAKRRRTVSPMPPAPPKTAPSALGPPRQRPAPSIVTNMSAIHVSNRGSEGWGESPELVTTATSSSTSGQPASTSTLHAASQSSALSVWDLSDKE